MHISQSSSTLIGDPQRCDHQNVTWKHVIDRYHTLNGTLFPLDNSDDSSLEELRIQLEAAVWPRVGICTRHFNLRRMSNYKRTGTF